MLPIYFPIVGSRLHSSMEETLIRSTEITCIEMSKEGRYMLQEAWLGKGKVRLKSVSKFVSVVQSHFGSLPHERDGMSAIAFAQPQTWNGVSGEAPVFLRRKAKVRRSWAVTSERFAAIRATHPTVGLLSLNRAT